MRPVIGLVLQKWGLATGMLNFMLGFGKLGPLEILQFLLPGLVIDPLFAPNGAVSEGRFADFCRDDRDWCAGGSWQIFWVTRWRYY